MKVVVPGHGVARVMDEVRKTVGGKDRTFVVLEIMGSGMTMFFPKLSDKYRPLSSREKIAECDQALSVDFNANVNQKWNKRYRRLMEDIKTGDIDVLVTVIRELRDLKYKKDLSFGERKLLDEAMRLYEQERTAVLN